VDGTLIFNSNREARKIHNLARNDRVAVVVGVAGEVTVQFEGIATITRDEERDAYGREYDRQFPGSRALDPDFPVVEVRPHGFACTTPRRCRYRSARRCGPSPQPGHRPVVTPYVHLTRRRAGVLGGGVVVDLPGQHATAATMLAAAVERSRCCRRNATRSAGSPWLRSSAASSRSSAVPTPGRAQTGDEATQQRSSGE
jgi:hypothetical protein